MRRWWHCHLLQEFVRLLEARKRSLFWGVLLGPSKDDVGRT